MSRQNRVVLYASLLLIAVAGVIIYNLGALRLYNIPDYWLGGGLQRPGWGYTPFDSSVGLYWPWTCGGLMIFMALIFLALWR